MTNNIAKQVDAWEDELLTTRVNRYIALYDKFLDILVQRMDIEARTKLYRRLDNVLFYSHAFLQSSPIQKDTRAQIIRTAKLFNPDITTINDLGKLNLEQLSFTAEQQIAKEKIIALIQGSITGRKGKLVTSFDLPVSFLLYIHAVQLVALSFGHETNKPYELMLCLKIFHASTLPKRFQKISWDNLVQELYSKSTYIYQGKEEIVNDNSLRPIYAQIFKHLAILNAKKRVSMGVPVLSIGISALSNYYLLNKVTDFALRFYQKRYLIEHR